MLLLHLRRRCCRRSPTSFPRALCALVDDLQPRYLRVRVPYPPHAQWHSQTVPECRREASRSQRVCACVCVQAAAIGVLSRASARWEQWLSCRAAASSLGRKPPLPHITLSGCGSAEQACTRRDRCVCVCACVRLQVPQLELCTALFRCPVSAKLRGVGRHGSWGDAVAEGTLLRAQGHISSARVLHVHAVQRRKKWHAW